MYVSIEMLLNAAKCQGYNFYRFWVIKGKPTGGGGKITTPPPPQQIGLFLLPENIIYKFSVDIERGQW